MNDISLTAYKELDESTRTALLKFIEEFEWKFPGADVNNALVFMYITYKTESAKDENARQMKHEEYRRRIFDLELYKEFRLIQRQRSSSVTTWPAALSRKEIAICKISMITTLFSMARYDAMVIKEGREICDIIETLLKSIESSVYKWKWDDSKPKELWPGIDPDAADFLNTLFKTFKKNYRKDLAVR
jgi:hypothetical protein